jgi:hypothetical protein
MPLDSDKINEVNSFLSGRGDKKKFAEFAGIHPTTLSDYLRYNKNLDCWVWPIALWEKFKEFKNQISC